MDITASEWSSGCESGWTVYLDESSQSPNKYPRGSRRSLHHQNYRANDDNDDDEEDLSMVSDASSGPPHVRYEDEEEVEVECYQRAGLDYPSSSEKSRKKKKAKEPKAKHQHSFLDDTASSPALSYSNRCMDLSNNQPSIDHFYGLSQGNGFTGNPAFGKQFGFWQSSHPRQQDSAEPSRSEGRRRG